MNTVILVNRFYLLVRVLSKHNIDEIVNSPDTHTSLNPKCDLLLSLVNPLCILPASLVNPLSVLQMFLVNPLCLLPVFLVNASSGLLVFLGRPWVRFTNASSEPIIISIFDNFHKLPIRRTGKKCVSMINYGIGHNL